MQRITVIPDVQEVIAKEVALLSSQYTHLITSGGIGPTHDDVTFESVAMAFQEELYPHPDLAQLVEEFFGVTDKNSSAMKLAIVPLSAKLNYGTDPQTGKPLRYPLVSELRIDGTTSDRDTIPMLEIPAAYSVIHHSLYFILSLGNFKRQIEFLFTCSFEIFFSKEYYRKQCCFLNVP